MATNYEIADKNTDADGNLQSFLVLWENGQPELKNATPTNTLLYLHGLHEFLNGNEGVILSRDPKVMVAPTGSEKSYILNVRGNAVETMPGNSRRVLEGIKQAVEDDSLDEIIDVFHDIKSSQVRKSLMNAMLHTFSKAERESIETVGNGWLIDGFYLVNWDASLYTADDDPESSDYQRGGGGVVETDKSYEAVQLSHHQNIEPVSVTVNGSEYRLTEREMMFLAKVKFILHREDYHADKPFWAYNDEYAKREGIVDATDDDDDTAFDGPKF